MAGLPDFLSDPLAVSNSWPFRDSLLYGGDRRFFDSLFPEFA